MEDLRKTLEELGLVELYEQEVALQQRPRGAWEYKTVNDALTWYLTSQGPDLWEAVYYTQVGKSLHERHTEALAKYGKKEQVIPWL